MFENVALKELPIIMIVSMGDLSRLQKLQNLIDKVSYKVP